MSILIKGMKMPTDCIECRFCDKGTLFCWATREFISGFGHPKFCPLEEVPTQPMKHRMSRAIDAVELKISIAYSNILEDGKSLDQIIDEQPTIEPEPQIVRCKDCKHYVDVNSRDPAINARYNYCTHQHCIHPKRDDFCSYGERKDG